MFAGYAFQNKVGRRVNNLIFDKKQITPRRLGNTMGFRIKQDIIASLCLYLCPMSNGKCIIEGFDVRHFALEIIAFQMHAPFRIREGKNGRQNI